MNNRLVDAALKGEFFSKLSNFLESIDSHLPNKVRVLTYHVIEDAQGFEQQMDFLSRNYYVASMHELIEACQGHSTLPPKSVVITFDDGYRNFKECAWPILKRYSFSATIFVPTAFPGNNNMIFWWDKLEDAFYQTQKRDPIQVSMDQLSMDTWTKRKHALKRVKRYVKTLPHQQALTFVDQICEKLECVQSQPRVLSWDELRCLAQEGVTIGAHTQTHPLLNRISLQEAYEEVMGSLKDLQRELSITIPIFAYPDGQYDDEVIRVVSQSGFYLAFTTHRGTNVLARADHFRMKRNNIGRQATQSTLRARLLQASMDPNRFFAYRDSFTPIA